MRIEIRERSCATTSKGGWIQLKCSPVSIAIEHFHRDLIILVDRDARPLDAQKRGYFFNEFSEIGALYSSRTLLRSIVRESPSPMAPTVLKAHLLALRGARVFQQR